MSQKESYTESIQESYVEIFIELIKKSYECTKMTAQDRS